MDKKIILGAFSILVVIILVSNILAITGSIGNARMILRADKGDEIEKYILVKNVNDVNVDIELSASGDLEEYIDIRDDNFSLSPGDEKKAYFTIDVAKSGTSTTKINVKFTPEEGNGVGLSSTVIVIADGGGLFEGSQNNEENELTTYKEEINKILGKVTGDIENNSSLNIAIIITMITLLLFVIVLILAFMKAKRIEKNKSKKRADKND